MQILKIMQRLLILLLITITIVHIYPIIKLSFLSIQETYELTWNIKFEDDLNLIYDIHTPTSFHGDGERFTIFEIPEDKINLQGFYKGIEHESFAEKTCDLLDVPEEYRPDFDKGYLWKSYSKNDTNKLLIIYFYENNSLYFFQHLQ